MLKARTLETNLWYSFTLKDIPVCYNNDNVALTMQPGSPLLLTETIVRGDPESKLFEGDIVEYQGDKYLICYERGFYAINENHVIRYIYTLSDAKVVGDYWSDSFPVQLRIRKKQLYKYKDLNFKLNDIIGHWVDKIMIRATNELIDPEECQQECGLSYNNKKLFFGDIVNGRPVIIAGGRICIKDTNGYLDLAKEAYLDGYNPRDIG